MATYLTYSSLVTDVTNYIERGGSAVADPTVYQQIPRLINNAERNIMQALKLLGTLETLIDNTGLAQGVAVIAKPDRWRVTVSLLYGSGADGNTRVQLLPRSYEYCRNVWPNDSTQDITQPPLYYSDFGLSNWLIAPTPPATYPLEVNAYMQPMLLDNANQTNFWCNYTPLLLLYETLLETTPFLKNDERIPTWERMRDFQLSTLNTQDLQRILDRTAERTRP